MEHLVNQRRLGVLGADPHGLGEGGRANEDDPAAGLQDSYNVAGGTPSYDVSPDGQHFVMIEVDREASRITHFNVILNWFEELRRPRPTKVARGVARGNGFK